MSAQTDILTNTLDTVAFALAGSEIVGIEKLTSTLNRIFTFAANAVDNFLSQSLFNSWLERLVAMFIFATTPLFFIGFYAGYATEVSAAVSISFYYFTIGLMTIFFACLGFFALGQFYSQLLSEGHQPNRALLIMGATVFICSRFVALNAAIKEEIPTIGEITREPLPVRLGPLQLPGPAAPYRVHLGPLQLPEPEVPGYRATAGADG